MQLTFAPCWAAFLTISRHWARLWAMLAVEVSCPTAWLSRPDGQLGYMETELGNSGLAD